MEKLDFVVSRNSIKYVLGKDGFLKGYSTNQPAFEFNLDGSYKGVLIESGITNLILYSEAFESWIAQNCLVVDNYIQSPTGLITASIIEEIETGVTERGVSQQFSQVIDKQYTFSCFIKKKQRTEVRLSVSGYSPEVFAYFDVANGQVLSEQNVDKSSIRYYGNDWYRCSITFTADLTANRFVYIQPSLNQSITYQDIDGHAIHFWGAQLEENYFASSYVETKTPSESRLPDNISLSNAQNYLSDEGSVIVKATFFENYQLNFFGITTTLTGENEIKIEYSPTLVRLFVNDTLIGEQAGSYDFSGMDKIELGSFNNGDYFNGNIQYFVIQ